MPPRADPRPQTVHKARRSAPEELLLQAGRRSTRAWGELTAPWRPAPDFLLLGAKRGGTTSAYFHVLTHPDVLPMFPSSTLLPKGRQSKGSHYFSSEYDRGPRWYAAHFPSRLRRALAERVRGSRPVCGEASPYYLFHPRAAERAARAVPQARLLVALRDPVDRTFSAWREQTRNGVETLDLEAALAAEPERVAGEQERLEADPDAYSFAHEFQTYAGQSAYAPSLRRWLEHFPREQLHVWASEDYYADPNEVVGGICAFLGLAPRDLPRIAPLNAAPPAPLPEALRAQLTARFRDDVAEVEELLGRRMPWPTARA